MRPSRDEMLMAHAKVAAMRATCSRAQVGVVIAREGRILSTGYNGAPSKMPHCDHTCDCKREGYTLPGEKLPHVDDDEMQCNSLKPCLISVHAEANAIAYAARHGMALEGAHLFSTWAPCNSCSQLIINAGITRVVFENNYRDPRGLDLLAAAGIALVSQKVV